MEFRLKSREVRTWLSPKAYNKEEKEKKLLFEQDSLNYHSTKTIVFYFIDHFSSVMKWSTLSSTHFTLEDLKQIIMDIWEKISQFMCSKLQTTKVTNYAIHFKGKMYKYERLVN